MIAKVENTVPGAREKLGEIVPALKPAPPPRDVSGTDIGPVARYPGLARSHWHREGREITMRYEGPADYAAVLDHYVKGFAAQGYAQNVLSATPRPGERTTTPRAETASPSRWCNSERQGQGNAGRRPAIADFLRTTMTHMTTTNRKPFLTIALFAAFADGAKDEREREEMRRIAESLADEAGAPDLARLYQDVLLKRVRWTRCGGARRSRRSASWRMKWRCACAMPTAARARPSGAFWTT